MRRLVFRAALAAGLVLICTVWTGPHRGLALASQTTAPGAAAPLIIGDTFTLQSKVLNETRHINVYRPAPYGVPADQPYPVLYMPDGGIAEDFLHVAGLVQVSAGNGTMRPFLLVGIENTERRRDMTGPTQNAEDKKIAPRVGGSELFRRFIRTELMPEIEKRYRTTGEKAIVGESLAGLFVVETLLLEPDLFDTYIAFDPSIWWDDERLVKEAPARLAKLAGAPKTLFVAQSDEERVPGAAQRFAAAFDAGKAPGVQFHFVPMLSEHHGTIYHPAALLAFRTLFKPQ